MNIAWTGEEVSYSWSGGSGTTKGCTNLGTSFSGQVAVGGAGGTIFEGNAAGMYWDVSFITGFSVPMLCSNPAGDKSGCSINLAATGTKCPQPSGTICTNPVGSNGAKQPGAYEGNAAAVPWCYACSAPDPYFQPCAGAGYTFPYDDAATQSSGGNSGTVTCCIGTGCGSTGREGDTKTGHAEPTRSPPCNLCSNGAGSKRDDLEGPAAPVPLANTLMARHGRSPHRHGLAHQAKALRDII